MSAAPPSICYSTQSFPARPIKIITNSPRGPVAVVASYAPLRGTYCTWSVSPAFARDIIDRPSDYAISWQPVTGGSSEISPLTHQVDARHGSSAFLRSDDATNVTGKD